MVKTTNLPGEFHFLWTHQTWAVLFSLVGANISATRPVSLSTCPAKNQAGCIERVVHHSHENQKFYLFKIAINEKCQKPKLTVKVIMVAMATAV